MNLCEICKSLEVCMVEDKSNMEACFFFYPTKEFLIKQTEEYSIGYQQGRSDERDRIRDILKAELESGYLLEKLLKRVCKDD